MTRRTILSAALPVGLMCLLGAAPRASAGSAADIARKLDQALKRAGYEVTATTSNGSAVALSLKLSASADGGEIVVEEEQIRTLGTEKAVRRRTFRFAPQDVQLSPTRGPQKGDIYFTYVVSDAPTEYWLNLASKKPAAIHMESESYTVKDGEIGQKKKETDEPRNLQVSFQSSEGAIRFRDMLSPTFP